MLLSRQGITLTIWMCVFTVVITLVIALRFLAVRVKKRALRADDYMILVAYVATLATEGLTWWGIANGLGAHTQELNPYELSVQFKILLGVGFTWLFATVFCKLSILWMYICIFTVKPFRYAAYVLMFIVAGYGISFICVFFTNCTTLDFMWNPVPGGSCKDIAIEEILSVSVNMVIDTAIVLLPMPVLWGLQLATRKKIAISGIFSLGLLVVAIMGWRVQITVQAVTQADFVYGLGNIGLVTHLEIWLGIIIACLPTLAPLFSKYLKPVVSKARGSKKSSAARQLKEAQNTIGGGDMRSYNSKRNWVRLDKEQGLLEMEDSGNFSKAEATVRTTSSLEDEESWSTKPNAIHMKQDIRVYGEPQSR